MADITIDDLATMLQKEFSNQREYFESNLKSLRSETKSDNSSLRSELKSDISSLRLELKSDISSLRSELKSDISLLRSEMNSRFDKLEDEIADIKKELAQIKKRTLDDDDVLSGEILKLQKRVIFLEKEVAKLKLQKAG